MIDVQDQNDLIDRLKKIEGQIRGIQKMIAEERKCADILSQMMASRAGIDKVAILLMNGQVEKCLKVKGEDSEQTMKVLEETLKNAIKFR